jgi:hypothetical protein
MESVGDMADAQPKYSFIPYTDQHFWSDSYNSHGVPVWTLPHPSVQYIHRLYSLHNPKGRNQEA